MSIKNIKERNKYDLFPVSYNRSYNYALNKIESIKQKYSKVKKIVTVGGRYYCIGGTDSKIYYTKDNQWTLANPYTTSTNTFTDIAIDDILVLVGTDKKLYYNKTLFNRGVNTLVQNQPAEFKAVSVSRGTIYALDTSGNPWYTPHYINTSWIQMNGTGINKQGTLEYISHRITVA